MEVVEVRAPIDNSKSPFGGAAMVRELLVAGMLVSSLVISGLGAWEVGKLWVYEIDGRVPPWSPEAPVSFATLEIVCVLAVEGGSAVLGVLYYTADGMRTWVASTVEGTLRQADGEWLPPAWEAGLTWQVNERVRGEVGAPLESALPGGEEVEVWPLSYFDSSPDGPFLEVLYSPAHGLEVWERWAAPCCSGTRQLVGRGVLSEEGALSLVSEGVRLMRSQGLVEEALAVATKLIELGFERARALLAPPG
ncbi:hypothetical protein DRJ54_07720 [Candidatus Acetothermia bacterium]|nr:MAG: hypothetical protein DRJ54_07720 [Candidatus Acetothermia bacterium]